MSKGLHKKSNRLSSNSFVWNIIHFYGIILMLISNTSSIVKASLVNQNFNYNNNHHQNYPINDLKFLDNNFKELHDKNPIDIINKSINELKSDNILFSFAAEDPVNNNISEKASDLVNTKKTNPERINDPISQNQKLIENIIIDNKNNLPNDNNNSNNNINGDGNNKKDINVNNNNNDNGNEKNLGEKSDTNSLNNINSNNNSNYNGFPIKEGTEKPVPSQNQNTSDQKDGGVPNNLIGFLKTTFSGFSVIVLAEIGDKTFFLVMIYSLDNSFWSTFLVASAVMLCWNFVCLMIGSAIPVLLFKGFLDFVGMCIFFFFGISMLYSAYHMENHLIHKGLSETKSELSRSRKSLSFKLSQEENNEQNNQILQQTSEQLREPLLKGKKSDAEANKQKAQSQSEEKDYFEEDEEEEFGFHSKGAFASALAIAEFGDKTQISAIVMGSTQNFYGVLLGTSLARITGVIIAVLLGNLIAHNITHKQVTYLGGIIFLFFAFVYMFKFFY